MAKHRPFSSDNGIAKKKVNALRSALEKKKLWVKLMIRTTNVGAIDGFDKKYAIGKALWAKAKSSDANFCEANLAVCPMLAKNFVGTNYDKINKVIQGVLNAKVVEDEISKDGNCRIIDKYLLVPNSLDAFIENTTITKETGKDVSYLGEDLTRTLLIYSEKIKRSEQSSLKLNYVLVEVNQKENDNENIFTFDQWTKNEPIVKYFYRASTKKRKKEDVEWISDYRLFRVFFTFAASEGKSGFDVWDKSGFRIDQCLQYNGKVYFPLQILAEKWAGKWYEIVADYDLFAVCPNTAQLKKDISCIPHYPLKETKDDSSILDTGKYDSGVESINDLGILSELDNEVRKLINTSFEIPVARHGCEVNNLIFMSKPEDVANIILIESESQKRYAEEVFDTSLAGYYTGNDPAGIQDSFVPYFIPFNPSNIFTPFEGPDPQFESDLRDRSINQFETITKQFSPLRIGKTEEGKRLKAQRLSTLVGHIKNYYKALLISGPKYVEEFESGHTDMGLHVDPYRDRMTWFSAQIDKIQ